MSWKIGMPNLGHTMEEGKVAEWLKLPGAAVTRGETIALVESDKSTFDIEAPADGVLLEISVAAGETVAVGTQIGLVGDPGEAVSAPAPAHPAAVAAAVAAAANPVQESPANRRARASPAARALAEALGVDIDAVTGTGEDGMITRDDIRGFHGAGR